MLLNTILYSLAKKAGGPFLFMIEIKGLQYPRNNDTFLHFFREAGQFLHKDIKYSNVNFNLNEALLCHLICEGNRKTFYDTIPYV